MDKEITRQEYNAEIERIARDALEEEREYGYDAQDIAWETVDSHRWVICSANAKFIPALASSDGMDFLIHQDLNAICREDGIAGLYSAIAFACMMEDVLNKLNELRKFENEEEAEE
ncbi:MAG: hypothetical protein C0P72_008920 [Clostridia bacterium]